MSFSSEIPVMWAGAGSKTLAGGANDTSDAVDMREYGKFTILITTTGAADHGGANTTIQPIFCLHDGTLAETQAGMNSIAGETAASADKYTASSLLDTLGVLNVVTVMSGLAISGIQFKATNGDATKAVTVSIKLLAERR